MTESDVKETIRQKALDIGFDVCGFTSAGLEENHSPNLKACVDQGRHASMDWMETRQDQRASPDALWPGAKSIIVLGLNYGPLFDPTAIFTKRDRGAISVYAQGKDYHDIVKKRLKQLGRWLVEEYDCEIKVFVDTAPVMEKPLAQQAGIGWQGKHTNVVSRDFGSWLFLGEVFTTLDLKPDPPEVDHCGNCTACLEACPTGAITPYELDANKCISYLTIEHSGPIAPDLARRMGNHIYGCDDCLAACPWTKFAKPHQEPHLMPRAEALAPRLSDLLKLNDEAFRQVFSGSPIKRSGIESIQRNAQIALANSTMDE